MKQYEFNNIMYELVEDKDTIFDYEQIKELVTDYFMQYDYIFADMAYNKIRLKGFCEKNNKNYKSLNDIKNLNNYICNYCAHSCKWFLLKKMQ